MVLSRLLKNGPKILSKVDTRFFLLFFTCVILISLAHMTYAQTQVNPQSEITLSENLQNDPIAQDLLKKIERTKKMIEELNQKEFEENQAKENLQKMRDISIVQLSKDLEEWDRMWERHSSKNSFESFVNKKPSYVHGVFWDQFEFKEQKVNAGRIAMNKVLTDGGTMHDARKAYDKAAATLRVEMIEMNAQINVKHNLADHKVQQLFNSTGQAHQSPTVQTKLAELYSDYKTQPTYILANLYNVNTVGSNSDPISDLQCAKGFTAVSRLTTGNQSCVDEEVAKKWMSDGITGIMIEGDLSSDKNNVKTNPATQCIQGHQVVYHVANAEYQCVLESDAKQMLEQNIVEIHSLLDYIASKDDQKIYEDIIYEINRKISEIHKEFDIKTKQLESKYDEIFENIDLAGKQKMQEGIEDYKTGDVSKEDIDQQITTIREDVYALKETMLNERVEESAMLESEKIDRILDAVKGYERNSDIDVDWDYLNASKDEIPAANDATTDEQERPIKITTSGKDDGVSLGNINVVNSFGHVFDEIRTDQVLQVSADIANTRNQEQDFAYVVEITDYQDRHVQPAKWATGTLNPVQTFNVSLSWIPEDVGEYKVSLFVGSEIDSVIHAADIEIDVNLGEDVSDESYCKNGSLLLFKYSDNSPICVSSDVAYKLVDRGLAFA